MCWAELINKAMQLTWLVPCECVGLTASPGELTGEYGNLAVGCRVGMDVGDNVAGDVVTGLCVVHLVLNNSNRDQWIFHEGCLNHCKKKTPVGGYSYVPNCTDCLNDRALDRAVCATAMGNERMSNRATIPYYFRLVFALYYHEPMDKCWKRTHTHKQNWMSQCTLVMLWKRRFPPHTHTYLIPGNLGKPQDDLGRVSFKLNTKLLPCSLANVLISILLLVFVMRRWATGLVGIGEWDPWLWWLSCKLQYITSFNLFASCNE